MNLSTYMLLLLACTNLFYLHVPDGPEAFTWLLTIFVIQGGGLWAIHRTLNHRPLPSLWWVFGLAVLARVIAGAGDPIFENDYLRYLWDGRVLGNGINPYAHAPTSAVLDHLNTDYREKIGYLHLRTIYPPLSELLFGLNFLLFGDSLYGLKLIFCLFDLATAGVVLQWLRREGRPDHWVLLYLFHPIVIKEIANSAHLDSIMVFFMVSAMYFLTQELKTGGVRSWLALSLSALSKVTSLALTPIIFKLNSNRIKGPLLAAAVAAAFSLPFYLTSDHFMAGLGAFSKYWVFNESLFYPISYLSTEIIRGMGWDRPIWMQTALLNEYPGRLVSAGLFGLWVLYRTYRVNAKSSVAREAMLIMGGLLLLAPVFNAWYSLWFLPFAVICGSVSAILLSGLTVMAYAWFWDKDYHRMIWTTEFVIFFLIVTFRTYQRYRKTGKLSFG